MALFTKTPRTTQPQGAIQVNTANPVSSGLVSLISAPLNKDIVTNKSVTITGDIAKILNPGGYGYKGSGSAFGSIDIGASGGLATVVDATKTFTLHTRFYLNAVNPAGEFLFADHQTSAASLGIQCLVYTDSKLWLYLYNSSAASVSVSSASAITTGWHDVVIVCNVSGGNTTATMYLDGVNQGSSGTLTGTINNDSALRFRFMSAGTYVFVNSLQGSIHHFAAFNADKTSCVHALSQNPWQLFAPVNKKLFLPTVTSSSTTLTGADSSQANNSTTGAITQTHVLTGANSAQANNSTTDAITQTHVLTGADCTQANNSTTDAITQTHVLTGANADQANNSTTGNITFPGTDLTADNCTQVNNSSTGAISQIHELLAQNSNQIIVSTTGAITQTHELTGADCTQANSCTTGSTAATQLSLTAEDIAAIAEAVWAHQSATACANRMLEVWGRLGLDADAPLLTGSTQITFGSVVMSLVEAAGVVSVIRQ